MKIKLGNGCNIGKKLQFLLEDRINKERALFAKNFKTYHEKAGGVYGSKAYLTILFHHKQIVYLHLFLFIILGWLYFDYGSRLDMKDIGGSFQKLVDMNTLFKVRENVIIVTALPIVLIVLFILIFNLILPWRLRRHVLWGTTSIHLSILHLSSIRLPPSYIKPLSSEKTITYSLFLFLFLLLFRFLSIPNRFFSS